MTDGGDEYGGSDPRDVAGPADSNTASDPRDTVGDDGSEPRTGRRESVSDDRSGDRRETLTPATDQPASTGGGQTATEEMPPALSEPRPGTIRPPDGPVGIDQQTLEAYTTDRRSLNATVQIQWGIWTTVGMLILGAILNAVLGNFGVDPLVGGAVVSLLVAIGIVWVVLRYRVWVYQIRDDSVYLERGVLTHVRTVVPYVRIQHVDTSRGPLERALGLSTLVVYTAGSRGADVSIPGLEPEQARDLQQRLKELAIEADGDDAL